MLTTSNPLNGEFGHYVAIDSDTAMIGDTELPGAAYVFNYNSVNGQWEEVQGLVPSDLIAGFGFWGFGLAIALEDSHALIGDRGDNGGAVFAYEYNSSTGLWKSRRQPPRDRNHKLWILWQCFCLCFRLG